MSNYYNSSMSNTNNHNTGLVTQMPSVFNRDNSLISNNSEFASLNKANGDDLTWDELSKDYPRLTSKFGTRQLPNESKARLHAGIDVGYIDNNGQKIIDSTIYSAGDGIVTKSGLDSKGGGNRIQIYHSETGYSTQYMHGSQLLVKEGEIVKEGQPIMIEGGTGPNGAKVYTEHLHLGVFEGKTIKSDKGNYIDPTTVNVGKYNKLEDTPYQKRENK